MIELCQHDHKYLATCQHYRAIFETPQIQEDEERWKAVSTITIHVMYHGFTAIDIAGVEECCAVCAVGSLRP